ncbi:hypothetical protein ABPG75_008110 [Micractinium tetrahymenae]
MGPPQPHEPQLHNGEQQRGLLGPRGLIDRVEYIRVLEQALRMLGYEEVAAALEAASGVEQQPPVAAAFRSAVLAGEYDAALRLLPAVAADGRVADRARFLLLRAKYIELMEAGATAAALQVLRSELQPLHVQQQVLHSLAALLLRSPAAASNGSASPDSAGAAGSTSTARVEQLAKARAALLEELQDSLLPSLLIPERRLEELVEQALLAQLESCAYFNSRATHLSLFTDFQVGAEQLPTQPGQVLEEHSSEVWSIAFSRDGLWAASASKDGSAVLWSVTPSGRFESPRVLLKQPVPCQLVAFSPDSSLLLAASMDCSVRLHDVATGKQLRQFLVADPDAGAAASAAAGGGAGLGAAAGAAAAAGSAGSAAAGAAAGSTVMALSWFPDSRRFLVATHRGLAVFDAQQAGSAPLRRLPCAHSYVYDALVGPGGGCIISVGQDKRIALTRLSDLRVEVIPESGPVTSIHLSPCGRFLTANLSDSLVHVWQLPDGLVRSAGAAGGTFAAAAALPHAPPAANGAAGGGSALAGGSARDPFDALPTAPAHELRMAGAKPSRYVLRSCVGGAASGFVAGGAEDCRLYIWSRRTGELLECLGCHSGCINATAWHPTNPWLLASASDDGTIRTWLAPAALRP